MRAGLFVFICILGACGIPGRSVLAGDTPNSLKPYGLTKRVPWTGSRVVGSPDPPSPYRLRRIFPRLKFQGPVSLAEEPGTNRLLVAENMGKIHGFPSDDQNAEKPDLFLDMKRQIYSFSFHPGYRENGYVFVFSPQPLDTTKGPQLSRVSRFETDRGSPRRVRPESEKIIVEWPAGGHNGGEAIFGPDGYLYVATGDGTSGSDVNDTGQGVNDLFSVIMRIDVDHPDAGRAYSIPRDNPFINFPGARPEVWAFGLRNPWRMSFDPDTGRLWVGDVGQDLWEMVRVVKKGENCGWSVQEGSHSFHPHKKVGPGPIIPPVVEHHHTECRSVTGGYVYRGTKFPELRGAYVYGDYQYGKIWALRYDGEKVTEHKELADTAVFIASFALGRDGDILAVDNTTGYLHALEHTPAGLAISRFPLTLGETGLFESVKDRRPAAGVIPYSVNAPYWSDGAHQDRLLGLPGEATLQVADAGSWGYPNGMVAAQTLLLDSEVGNPRSQIPVETRLLVRQDDHWMGYTYLWNETSTEATLVGAIGAEHLVSIKDKTAPGGVRRTNWRVPGRNECMFCHSRAAGFILGVNPAQMNRDQNYGDIVDNQLRALDHIGIFQPKLPAPPESLERLVDPYDEKADLESRARTYLHVNCAICHVSDGGGNSLIELDRTRTLANTKTVGTRCVQGSFGIDDAKVITPGSPERSVLYYRIASVGGARMPRVGSRVADERGLALFHEWIKRMHDPAPSASGRSEREEIAALLRTLRDGSASAKPARVEAIRGLTARTSLAIALARVTGRGELTPTVRAEVLAATRDHSLVEVRDLFERFLPDSERVPRLSETIDPRVILELRGDVERGRAIFSAESAVNCKSCHRLAGVGVELGPDLAKIGGRYPRAELLAQILEPSRTIDAKYVVHRVATTSGIVHSGLLVKRTEKEVVLRDSRNQQVEIPVSEIEEITPQKASLMPELLLRGLTAQQAADLLEYLSVQK